MSAIATAMLAIETSEPKKSMIELMVPAPFACGSVMGSTASIIIHDIANRGQP